MIKQQTTKQLRAKRLPRIRAKLFGTKERPRVVVYKSNYALSAQLVDDSTGVVMLSHHHKGKNKEAATVLAAEILKQTKAKKITHAIFDRSGYRYHGVVKVFADALREGGLSL